MSDAILENRLKDILREIQLISKKLEQTNEKIEKTNMLLTDIQEITDELCSRR